MTKVWINKNGENAVKVFLRSAYARAVAFYRAYPARSISYIVAGIVALGGLVGATVDADTLSGLLTLVLPILLGGEAVHRQVTPVAALTRSATVPIQVQLDGAKVAEAVVSRAGDVDAPGKRAKAVDEPQEVEEAPRCRHGHVIDGSNGDCCPHGHPA